MESSQNSSCRQICIRSYGSVKIDYSKGAYRKHKSKNQGEKIRDKRKKKKLN
jgi:hypothetical protein